MPPGSAPSTLQHGGARGHLTTAAGRRRPSKPSLPAGRGQPLPQHHTTADTPLTLPGPRALPQGTGRPSTVP